MILTCFRLWECGRRKQVRGQEQEVQGNVGEGLSGGGLSGKVQFQAQLSLFY